ncbi:hypothetical protein [Megasphaera paucivorans]
MEAEVESKLCAEKSERNKERQGYGLPHISIQSFRKMAVTYVLPSVNLKEASEFARHSNIQITAKAYSEVLSSRREIPTMLLNNIVDDAIQSQGIKINIPTKNDKIIPINAPVAEKKSQKQAPKAK